MKTWKTVLCACRSTKSGRFASKGKCKAFKRTKIRATRGTLFALALTSLALLTGCQSQGGIAGTLDHLFFKPTAWQTNVVPEHVEQIHTNRLVVIQATDPAGVVSYVTNREAIVLNVPVPASTTITPIAWTANPTTTAAIETGAGFVPGYGTLIGWGATALLGIVAQLRSRKFKDAAVSVAQGVAHYVALKPENAAALQSVLKAVQEDHGTRATVAQIISDHVETTPAIAGT